MPKTSAGLLLYRRTAEGIEVFLVHPGGPFWATKDDGAWSIPKGEFDDGEDPLAAACRELTEETGCVANAPFIGLGSVVLRSRKIVHAWACEGACDAGAIRSNSVTIEWPPKSGKRLEIPEVDRAAWCSPQIAKAKLNPAQAPFVDRLREQLGVTPSPAA